MFMPDKNGLICNMEFIKQVLSSNFITVNIYYYIVDLGPLFLLLVIIGIVQGIRRIFRKQHS